MPHVRKSSVTFIPVTHIATVQPELAREQESPLAKFVSSSRLYPFDFQNPANRKQKMSSKARRSALLKVSNIQLKGHFLISLFCFPSRPTGSGLQVLPSHSLALGGISITNPDSSLSTLGATVAFLDHSYKLLKLSFTVFAILVPKKRMFKLRSHLKLTNLASFDEQDTKHGLTYIFYFIFTDYNKQEKPYLEPKHSNNKFKTKKKKRMHYLD